MKGMRVVLLFLAVMSTGCAADPADPVSLSSWQKSLESYVWEQADGDPNVLRDMSWDDVHDGFAVMSDALPARSIDILGLLVAHRRVEGRPCFVFAVATVRDQRLENLRPVALCVAAGRFHWFIGAENAGSLATYRRWLVTSESAGGADEQPAVVFPAPADIFHVAVEGSRISIVHDPTGAAWQVRVKPAGPATTRSNSSKTPRLTAPTESIQ